ncbi:mannose-6-phosphate isomerase [Vibrio ishigakensis]|uniref:Mannose-6-phosphate isomerase n=1 Tax=Vibrio ishigakensis TaxID=1481914 RepID=A0A0B8NIC0_9VIBR|nr:mannose-6-phosphate isomerase [Vibrio ishigakensis]GAM77548.1 mannose-6-phosphate isomerase [Vibrio ishigakensis]
MQVEVKSAEILMALESDLTLTHESGESVSIAMGESVFVPFSSQSYSMQSSGRVARLTTSLWIN